MTHTPLAKGEPLSPCPRCGGPAVGDEPYPGDYDTGGIHCDDCGYWTGEDMDRDEAIEWWNTRPLVDSLQARIAELERNEANYQAVFLLYVEQVDIGAARIAELEAQAIAAPAVTGVPSEVAFIVRGVLQATLARIKREGTDVLPSTQWTMQQCEAALAWLSQQQGGEANA